MNNIEKKFQKLAADHAPGQEIRQKTVEAELTYEKIEGKFVDFSHGDVDAFPPIADAFTIFAEGVESGAKQAYTEYRGSKDIREYVLNELSKFTGTKYEVEENIIITPGTQGALFLAMGSLVSRGDRVAIVEPDYFANRKLVEYFDGEIVPVELDYYGAEEGKAGINLNQLESAFQSGVKLFLFSNPNNPTGVVYSKEEIKQIAELAIKYDADIIVDQLYSRQVFDHGDYTHFCAEENLNMDNVITIMGPSKTESLSGYRLGVAFGSAKIIDRMEKLQAIVSLRAGGYSQAVLKTWFAEPEDWMKQRLTEHQAIRDDLVNLINSESGFKVRKTEAGSYLFPQFPELKIDLYTFVKLLRLQAGVIVTPGTEFGPQFTNSFRVNFSQDHKAAVSAMQRIIQVVKENKK